MVGNSHPFHPLSNYRAFTNEAAKGAASIYCGADDHVLYKTNVHYYMYVRAIKGERL